MLDSREGIDVADKLTQAVLDGLTRAAAEPAGLPLYASKSEHGLFSGSAAVKPAAQKALAEGFLHTVRTEPRGKAEVALYALSGSGWEYLLAQVNPKQVLEDFVRVLESRQGEVDGLLAVVRRMADSLDGLKEAVARVLPRIIEGKLHRPDVRETADRSAADRTGDMSASRHTNNGTHDPNGVAVLELPVRVVEKRGTGAELAGAIQARLADWAASAAAGQDCPLPELFRSLSAREPRRPSASSTTASAPCTRRAESTCTRGPARSTPCRSRRSPCSSATGSRITPASVKAQRGRVRHRPLLPHREPESITEGSDVRRRSRPRENR